MYCSGVQTQGSVWRLYIHLDVQHLYITTTKFSIYERFQLGGKKLYSCESSQAPAVCRKCAHRFCWYWVWVPFGTHSLFSDESIDYEDGVVGVESPSDGRHQPLRLLESPDGVHVRHGCVSPSHFAPLRAWAGLVGLGAMWHRRQDINMYGYSQKYSTISVFNPQPVLVALSLLFAQKRVPFATCRPW